MHLVQLIECVVCRCNISRFDIGIVRAGSMCAGGHCMFVSEAGQVVIWVSCKGDSQNCGERQENGNLHGRCFLHFLYYLWKGFGQGWSKDRVGKMQSKERSTD